MSNIAKPASSGGRSEGDKIIHVLVAGVVKGGSTKAPGQCAFAESARCAIDTMRCTGCATVGEVLERATGSEGVAQKMMTSLSGAGGASSSRLPALESERAESDALAAKASAFIENVHTFETSFRGILSLPASGELSQLAERHRLLAEHLSTIDALNTEYGELSTLLDEKERALQMGPLTPREKELFLGCSDTIRNHLSACRFLTHYFETMVQVVEKAPTAGLIHLHTKTEELAQRLLSGERPVLAPPLSETLKGRLRAITLGKGMNLIEKFAQLPVDGVTEAKRRAFRSIQNEIQKLVLLNGAKHVVPHFFARITSNVGRLFLERAESDLLQAIFSSEGISAAQLKKFLRDTLEGIASTHEKGIIHNDVKPENVLVINGEAFLADFGAARFEGETCLGGTRAYSAPERLYRLSDTTAKSDMWSFGVLCFVALTAHYPFTKAHIEEGTLLQSQKNISERIEKVLTDERERLAVLDPECAGQDVIRRLLLLDPEARPSTRELLSHGYFT